MIDELKPSGELQPLPPGDLMTGAGLAFVAGVCVFLGVKAGDALWEAAREKFRLDE